MSEPDISGHVSIPEASGGVTLPQSVQAALCESLDVVDLYEVAATLQPLHPEYSIVELAKHVAKIAVKRGFRHFAWEPPEG